MRGQNKPSTHHREGEVMFLLLLRNIFLSIINLPLFFLNLILGLNNPE